MGGGVLGLRGSTRRARYYYTPSSPSSPLRAFSPGVGACMHMGVEFGILESDLIKRVSLCGVCEG